MSFKRKLFLYCMILSIVPVFVLGMFSSQMASKNVQEEVDHNHRIILKQLEVQVDSFMKNLDHATLQLANDRYLQKSMEHGISVDDLQMTLYMMDAVQKMIDFSDIDFQVTLYYENFDQLYSSKYGVVRSIDSPYTDITELAKLRHNGLTVIPANTYQGMPELMMVRSIPLNSIYPDGYVILHLDINNLKRFIDQLDLGKNRKVIIVDDQEKIVTSRDVEDIGILLEDDSPLKLYQENREMNDTIRMGSENYNVSSIRSTVNNWNYIAMTPLSELTEKSDRIRWLTLSIMAIVVGIGFIFTFFATRHLYFPIKKIIGRFTPEEQADGAHDELQAIDSFMSRIQQSNQHLQTQIKEQKPYLTENILHQLLRGEVSSREVHEFAKRNEFGLKGKWFYACIIDIDHYENFSQKYNEKDRSLMMYALRNMIEELANPLKSYVTVTPIAGQVVLVVGMNELTDKASRSMIPISQHILENVRRYFEFTVSVVISDVRSDYESIYDSYQEALSLLEYRWITGPNHVITPDDVDPNLKKSSRMIVEWKSEVVASIKQGDFPSAMNQLTELRSTIPNSLNHSDSVLALFVSLISEIDHYLNGLGYDLADLFEYDLISYLYGLSSLEEVTDWFNEKVIPNIESHLEKANLSNQKRLIPQVLSYIEEHYEMDLSLQMIADEFDVSPSMLSRMFKEEMDENYIDYIIRFRMDRAKEWLIHTEMTIKEITDRLRYTSVQNFSRIFKQVTGSPPGAYRKMHRSE